MSYEKRVKSSIKQQCSDIAKHGDVEQSQLEEIIEECVSVDESRPLYNITATQSRKPSNIKVEFDVVAGLEILSQADFLSGDPLEAFAAFAALCALVSRRMKIDLEPETGFVYWVAYDNQHDPWEIPKEELIELAVENSKSMDVPFELTEDEVEHRIQHLCRINSFKKEYRSNKEHIILRERCSSDWSS